MKSQTQNTLGKRPSSNTSMTSARNIPSRSRPISVSSSRTKNSQKSNATIVPRPQSSNSSSSSSSSSSASSSSLSQSTNPPIHRLKRRPASTFSHPTSGSNAQNISLSATVTPLTESDVDFIPDIVKLTSQYSSNSFYTPVNLSAELENEESEKQLRLKHVQDNHEIYKIASEEEKVHLAQGMWHHKFIFFIFYQKSKKRKKN